MKTFNFKDLVEMELSEILVNFPAETKAQSGRLFKAYANKLAPSFNAVLAELGYKITANNTVSKRGAYITNGSLIVDRGLIRDDFDTLENLYLTDAVYYYRKYRNL